MDPTHACTPRSTPTGGQLTTPVPPESQGFAYLLVGEAALGANKHTARPPSWSRSVRAAS